MNPNTLIKTLVVSTVAVIVLLALLPTIISISSIGGEAAVHPTVNDSATLATSHPGEPRQLNVRATQGNALLFNETDSVETSAPQALANDSWSIAVAAQLDEASVAPATLTYDIYAYENETILVQYDHGYWSVYYTNGTHDALARVPAPSPRDDFTPVVARYNNTTSTLWISRAGDAYDSDTLDTTTNPRNVSTGWVGRLDEVRTYNQSVSNATITDFGDDQAQPFPGTGRTSRMMFDEGEGSETAVYWTRSGTQQATINGAEWTGGISGPETGGLLAELVGTALSEGDDYVITYDPLAIQLVEDGYLEGAPVVYVSWVWTPLAGPVLGFIPVMLGLLVLVGIARKVQEAT